MMRRTCCPLVILVVLSILLNLSPAWGLGGSGHAKLWNDVLGIADRQSEEAIQPLWDAAQDVIDSYRDDYRELRGKFPWFTWGSYGHRLLFHWGFEAAPKEHPQLKKQVEKCLKGREDKKEQFDAFFHYLTRTIQARRNKKLINALVQTTGVPTARGYANALATIIYDVHLLGDYQTPATSALPSINKIETDLVQRGFYRLLTGGDRTERLNEIKAELDAAVRVGRGRIDSKRAQNLIDTTKRLLPPLLNERFKNTLKEQGITITEPEI